MAENWKEEIIVEETHSKKQIPWARVGIWLTTLGMAIFIVAFSFGYFQLASINVSLAHLVSDLQNQTLRQQSNIEELQNTLRDIQQRVSQSQATIAQQGQAIAEWRAVQRGGLERWQAAEAHYLVKIAHDNLQLTANIPLAITLLQSADRILQGLQDPNLVPIRKEVAEQLATLQATPRFNLDEVYVQLLALNQTLDQLPLPLNIKEQASTTLPDTKQTWWKSGLERSFHALQRIMIVRYHPAGEKSLVLPEEKNFLYQNLHAQLENAMWGLLHKNGKIYQSSLAQTAVWIQQYFQQDAPLTQSALNQIQELQKVEVQPKTPDLTTILQLFHNYFGQAEPGATSTQS